MNIHYKIKFFSDWHCGSGLSAGADIDLLVIKDQKTNLPYIPGKTMKGLIREAVEEIEKLSCLDPQSEKGETSEIGKSASKKVFGYFDKESKAEIGLSFFTNATLSEGLQNAVVANNLSNYFYQSVASTAIGDNGVAKQHSLRRMEVAIPCELEGAILNVPDDLVNIIKDGLFFIKRLGQHRNRGLGRCQITIEEKGVEV